MKQVAFLFRKRPEPHPDVYLVSPVFTDYITYKTHII